MSYDFPSNPVQGQEFTPVMGGQIYVWYSPRWLVKGNPPLGGGAASIGIEEAPVNGKQHARFNATWSELPANATWANLSGKPATFPPEAHVHAQSEVTGLPAALSAKESVIASGTVTQWWRGDKTWQSLPVTDWTAVANKPTTFTPSVHGHTQNEIQNLIADLSGKAPTVHTHAQVDVVGLTTALAGKEASISSGTTAQYWRGDKSWQTLPTYDWTSLSGKPSTFPPSTHSHAIADVTDLQNQLNLKAASTHTHAYSALTGIPLSFTPSAHVHAQADVTNLVADLGLKALKASPVFTGTVTCDAINADAITGTSGVFSSSLEAGVTITAKGAASGNVHLWLRGPANEDRMVLYTASASAGSTSLRVGGTQTFIFGSTGLFTSPAGISTTTGAFSGALSAASISTTGAISAGGSITGGIHVYSDNYVYANAGHFIGTAATAVIGTASGGVGIVYLRPAGYSNPSKQTIVDGSSGNLTCSGHILSNTGYFVGSASTAILGNVSGAGTVLLRPNGHGSGLGQAYVNNSGDLYVYRSIDANGNVTAAQNFISSTAALVLGVTSSTGAIYLRPVNSTETEQAIYTSQGNLHIGNQGYKATSGSWAATSDARIKNIIGDYEFGLAEIRELKVRRYTYKGNETLIAPPNSAMPCQDSPHYRAAINKEIYVSLVAQEAEAVMPDLVTQGEAWIDGQKVEDFRTLDPTNVTWALVNAVRELADRLEIAEAKLKEKTA